MLRRQRKEFDCNKSRLSHCVYAYSFAEAMVLIHFVVLALMWLTRDPDIVPGWQSLLPHKFVNVFFILGAVRIRLLWRIISEVVP